MLDKNTRKIVYRYDALNRLLSARYDGAAEISYTYDPADNLLALRTEDIWSAPAQEKIREADEQTEQQLWYMSRNGEQYGPYLLEELVKYVQEGRVQPEDLVWHQGLPQWVEAGTLEEFNFG